MLEITNTSIFYEPDNSRIPSTDGGETFREIAQILTDNQQKRSDDKNEKAPSVPVNKDYPGVQLGVSQKVGESRGLFLRLLEKIFQTKPTPVNFSSRREPSANPYRAAPLSARKRAPSKNVAPWARL